MGLFLWFSRIDDCECFGRDDEVKKWKKKIMKLFDCDDVGNMDGYVGWKINVDDGFTFTQTVMFQSFGDEFSLPKIVTATPLIPGNKLRKATEDDFQPPEETTYFHKVV